MTELKPCPFCGGEAELTYTNDNNKMPFVRCKYGCYLNPPCYACQYPWNHKTEKDAIDSWNRRAEKNAVRYRADIKNGKYVCSECGHNVIWNPECESTLMEYHPYCNTCGAKFIGIEDYELKCLE